MTGVFTCLASWHGCGRAGLFQGIAVWRRLPSSLALSRRRRRLLGTHSAEHANVMKLVFGCSGMQRSMMQRAMIGELFIFANNHLTDTSPPATARSSFSASSGNPSHSSRRDQHRNLAFRIMGNCGSRPGAGGSVVRGGHTNMPAKTELFDRSHDSLSLALVP
jgi:hypothetical protein